MNPLFSVGSYLLWLVFTLPNLYGIRNHLSKEVCGGHLFKLRVFKLLVHVLLNFNNSWLPVVSFDELAPVSKWTMITVGKKMKQVMIICRPRGRVEPWFKSVLQEPDLLDVWELLPLKTSKRPATLLLLCYAWVFPLTIKEKDKKNSLKILSY